MAQPLLRHFGAVTWIYGGGGSSVTVYIDVTSLSPLEFLCLCKTTHYFDHAQ